jgi:proline dehydrogenase
VASLTDDPPSMEDTVISKNPVPDFEDARAAYESKSTTDLLRAAACFKISRFPILVENAEPLLRVTRNLLGGSITDFFLKKTLFGHFCAGEDQKRIQPILKKLDESGIGSILDYAAESEGSPEPAMGLHQNDGEIITPQAREYDYESEAQCDKHVAVFTQCINDVASLGPDGYAAIKVTALGNPKLLARMSQAIVEVKKLFMLFDENNDGYVSRAEFEQGYK